MVGSHNNLYNDNNTINILKLQQCSRLLTIYSICSIVSMKLKNSIGGGEVCLKSIFIEFLRFFIQNLVN
jgi:hypothetical protein